MISSHFGGTLIKDVCDEPQLSGSGHTFSHNRTSEMTFTKVERLVALALHGLVKFL